MSQNSEREILNGPHIYFKFIIYMQCIFSK